MTNQGRILKVIIADDQEILTEGLKMLLSREDDIQVIGSARTGSEAYDKVKEAFDKYGIQGLPDVVVMDIRMPEMNGIEATRVIKRDFPMVKILVLTTFKDDEYIFDAVKEGASGYLLKESTPEEIAEGIRIVAGGGALMEPEIANRVLAKFVSISKGVIDDNSYAPSPQEVRRADSTLKDNPDFKPIYGLPSYDLTERELDIAIRIGEGKNNMEIGNELYLSEGTVKNHVSKILDKLDLRDRTQLAIFALKKLKK